MEAAIRYLLEAEEIRGEHRVNRIRLLVAALFLLVFAGFYLKSERHYTAGYVILADLITLFSYAIFLRYLLARKRYQSYLKYLSATVDISCLMVMAISSLFLSRSLDLQGWVTNIAVFFLFIAISGLRFSPGLCLFTSLVTVVEFLLLNWFIFRAGGEPVPLPQMLTIATLLLAAGAITALTARSARQLIVRAGMAESRQSRLATEASHARHLAITDELSGLFNRRHFLAELKREIARSSQLKKPFAVLIIDLDHFKQVNDTLGHLAGDMVMKEVAAIFRQNSRETDVIARIGGDEFGLILCEADLKQATMVAERLCKVVKEHEFKISAEINHLSTSISIGLTCFPVDATQEEDLLKSADRALYQAKALGRGRVARAKDLVEAVAEHA